MDFVLGLGIALPATLSTAISVTTGVAQGVSEQKKVNADASNLGRMLKFHLDVWIDPQPGNGAEVEHFCHNGIVTIREGKLWVEPRDPVTQEPATKGHHPFTGFYIAYPDDNRGYTRGLVSTISVDPPELNWIYVDKDTLEIKHATRTGSIAHHVGDYDWTTEDAIDETSCVTLDGWEGFVALEERAGEWALYYDWEDDGLKKVNKKKRKTIEVHLQRRIITGQEVNKWGLKEEGNIGFKTTREV